MKIVLDLRAIHCVTPTCNTLPKDVESRVETMTEEATKKIATKGNIMNYFKNLFKNDETIKQ